VRFFSRQYGSLPLISSLLASPHLFAPASKSKSNPTMSDSKNVLVNKLRRRYPGTGRPSNLDIIDDTWTSDTLSDDEVEIEQTEQKIAPLLEDESELDDAVISTANSGSAAMGALELRRKEEGRWNDLGLDLFDNGSGSGSGMTLHQSGGGGGGGGGQR